MILQIFIISIIFLTSIFSTIILIPHVINFAKKRNLFDYPDKRKQRSSNNVRLGGIAIILSFLLSSIIFLFLSKIIPGDQIHSFKIVTLVVGSLLYFFIGLIDDIYNLPPWPKLFLQLVFGFILWEQGIKIQNITFSLFIESKLQIPNSLSLILTVSWVGAITNSINWIDGLDGLAIGVSAICFIPITILNFQNGNFEIAVLSIIIIGTCLGFLRFNYKPSKILMGDGGSYFLGINLASMSILSGSLYNNNSSFFNQKLDILCTLMIVSLPLLDLIKVILTRIIKRSSPFKPDREHIHHKLVDKGIEEKLAVKIIYSIAILTASITLLYKNIDLLLIISTFAILFLIGKFMLSRRVLKTKN